MARVNRTYVRDRLEQEACKGQDRGAHFLFTGTRADIERMYAVMDVFVLPSLTEGVPMALLEAMSSRKVAVATRVGGVPMIIEDGRSGNLVEAGEGARWPKTPNRS